MKAEIKHPKKKNGKCSTCGFRIRSNKHIQGDHHKGLIKPHVKKY